MRKRKGRPGQQIFCAAFIGSGSFWFGYFICIAAAIRPMNIGSGLKGLEVRHGCDWVPMKNG